MIEMESSLSSKHISSNPKGGGGGGGRWGTAILDLLRMLVVTFILKFWILVRFRVSERPW